MYSVGSHYQVEVDTTNQIQWHEILGQFNDANIYQSWSYGSTRWGHANLSHIIVRRDGELVGAAQACVKKVPFLSAGIAYIPWGPLWRPRHGVNDTEDDVNILRAIRTEYVSGRNLVLRVSPNCSQAESNIQSVGLQSEAFRLSAARPPYHTLMVDLTRPIDELRRALNPKWRNKLSGAEKLGLEVIEGDTDDLYRSFMVLQREMLARKDYQTAVNYEEFSRVQSDLPKSLKMRIFLCRHESEVVSSAICSAMGNTGIYLLGATGDKGLKVKGSYLLQWRIMQWLQTHNFRWYDLGGINPEKNPGVYSFKAGLPGKEVYHMGLFESSDGMSSSLVVKLAEMLKQGRGAVRSALSRTRLARAQQ